MSMKRLAKKVDDEGGVRATDLGELRDAVEAGKLGRLVMERIVHELDAHGLGYFPTEVLDYNEQPRQWEAIRLYRKGASATARAIEAVISPNSSGDAFLVELGANNAQEQLQRIREIVAIDGQRSRRTSSTRSL